MTPSRDVVRAWSREDLAAFAARYACVEAGKGGVAVDLVSGMYWSLNSTAVRIVGRMLGTPADELITRVAHDFAISEWEASRAIEAVTQGFTARGPTPAVPTDNFPYRRSGKEYILYHQERPLLHIDAAGAQARLAAPGPVGFPLGHILRLASPKVLQVNGVTVMHAAAVGQDRLTVVSGRSGAGKSTTARFLVEAWHAPAFADDLLILEEHDRAPRARAGAEAAIYRWCDEAGLQLAAHPDRPIELSGLLAAATDPSAALVPIDHVMLVAVDRRGGNDLALERLTPEAAIIEMASTVFLGAAEPATVLHFFRACAALARSVSISRASVPDGLPGLRAAVARYVADYSSKTTSNR
jgi:hypothetical protein